MSAFYTTKALGRDWMPSPVRNNSRIEAGWTSPINSSRRGRYDSWPSETPKLHWKRLSPSRAPLTKRWSKVHERFALAFVLLLLVSWFVLSRNSFLQRHDFHLPHSPWTVASTIHQNAISPPPGTKWSDFAYATYATDTQCLCNSLMLLESLHRLNSQPARLLLYPSGWDVAYNDSIESRLLAQARDMYSATLQPVDLQILNSTDETVTWASSPTKLLAFNQTQFTRILALDSDSTLLQHLDELFHLPDAPVAMPRAYWQPLVPAGGQNELTSALTLLTPSTAAFANIQAALAIRGEKDFDMEILNNLYGDSALILPHQRNILLTGEFRGTDHAAYLEDIGEVWDPKKVLNEAKFVHFSDWPLPKPWMAIERTQWEAQRPACAGDVKGGTCADREIWEGLYRDFRERRERVRGSEMVTWKESEHEMEVLRVLTESRQTLANAEAALSMTGIGDDLTAVV